MFTVYLIKVFGVETLAVALALIKCCWVAKCLEKLFYESEFLGIQIRIQFGIFPEIWSNDWRQTTMFLSLDLSNGKDDNGQIDLREEKYKNKNKLNDFESYLARGHSNKLWHFRGPQLCHKMTNGGGKDQPKCHLTFSDIFEPNFTIKSIEKVMLLG